MDNSFDDIVNLLKTLIGTPSFSREEEKTAGLIYQFLENKKLHPERHKNNVFARNKFFDESKPTILLNSHHDTVKPNNDWTRDPFLPEIDQERLYGLGSNDAGASLVSLLSAFLHYYDSKELKYNLIFLASAEEEISGKDGVEAVLKKMPPFEFGIVGEPTSLQMAVAEKGLMVVDCVAQGKSGHAARTEGENAIYNALEDIRKIRTMQFTGKSDWLGKVKMTVTLINAGTQHNVIPDRCNYTIDVRSTDIYPNEEILDRLKNTLSGTVTPRSLRLNSSSISGDHVLVKAAKKSGISLFGSSTLSDQALMAFPTVKIGPGDSSLSHTADEFIFIDEIKKGIALYTDLIGRIMVN